MLSEECYAHMVRFRIRTFADTLRDIASNPKFDAMSVDEKIEMATEAEVAARFDRRVAKNNKAARFKDKTACPENILFLPDRSLTRDMVDRMTACKFVRDGHNIIVVSKSGCGKSYLSQAIGNAACREGLTVRYVRHADLNRELNIARINGGHYDKMHEFESVDLLIIDDLFLEETNMMNTTDLFEIIETRGGTGSLLLASQLTPEEWHLRIDTKIIADALLDRVVHNSYLVKIEGPNMREYCARKALRR